MASLVESLVETLESENTAYQQLLKLSQDKTQIIVKGDVEALERITEEEQSVVAVINGHEKMRMSQMKEIAKILNTDVETLKLDNLIALLARAPKDQQKLAKVHDKLKLTLHEMKLTNERNESLLGSAIEMVNFNLSLVQAMRKAPETANYNKGAYSTGSAIGNFSGSFDAKQ